MKKKESRVALELLVRSGILGALKVCSEANFVDWANGWLDGSDRTRESAWRALERAWNQGDPNSTTAAIRAAHALAVGPSWTCDWEEEIVADVQKALGQSFRWNHFPLFLFASGDHTMPAWAMPCPKCNKRIEWDGEFYERPPCRHCTPSLPRNSVSAGSVSFPTLTEDDSREAIDQCDLIFSLIDDLPEAADDFADFIREKTQSILAWIEKNGHCTERQAGALDNMENGVRKWLE